MFLQNDYFCSLYGLLFCSVIVAVAVAVFVMVQTPLSADFDPLVGFCALVVSPFTHNDTALSIVFYVFFNFLSGKELEVNESRSDVSGQRLLQNLSEEFSFSTYAD